MKPLTVLLLLLALALCGPGVVEARPQGVKVLYYSSGMMARVYKNRTNPAFARTGDYVKGMRRRADADCMTAVNWQSRWMLGANVVLVVDLWDAKQKRWERHRCQPVDHQQRRHSTGTTQRLEIDYQTAKSVNMIRNGTTTARIVRVEK